MCQPLDSARLQRVLSVNSNPPHRSSSLGSGEVDAIRIYELILFRNCAKLQQTFFLKKRMLALQTCANGALVFFTNNLKLFSMHIHSRQFHFKLVGKVGHLLHHLFDGLFRDADQRGHRFDL